MNSPRYRDPNSLVLVQYPTIKPNLLPHCIKLVSELKKIKLFTFLTYIYFLMIFYFKKYTNEKRKHKWKKTSLSNTSPQSKVVKYHRGPLLSLFVVNLNSLDSLNPAKPLHSPEFSTLNHHRQSNFDRTSAPRHRSI